VNDGPATAVLEMESKHASAVIVGTDDVDRMRRFMGAEVARHVAMHSHAPVFVVPFGTRVKELRDVVLEIDENNVADGPIRFAVETASRTGARLRVMHVVPRTVYLADPAEHGARLTRLVETWQSRYPGTTVSPSLVCGDVEDEAVIASTSAQLMVVGRPNEPQHGPLFGLHVAEEIVRRSQCPVVVVPAEYQP
jgi:nucleotide-binding universal stress UspA family protein